jgi:glycosyltransferase involved in cell wall biosynthesis
MEISVIIATYNRAAMLAGVLDRLQRQRVPAGTSWEVLVVDNNSTDGTAETAADVPDTGDRRSGPEGR